MEAEAPASTRPRGQAGLRALDRPAQDPADRPHSRAARAAAPPSPRCGRLAPIRTRRRCTSLQIEMNLRRFTTIPLAAWAGASGGRTVGSLREGGQRC